MTKSTVVHNHDNGNNMSVLLTIIIVLFFMVALFYFGIPYLRSLSVSTPQINVPEKIDVNVQQK